MKVLAGFDTCSDSAWVMASRASIVAKGRYLETSPSLRAILRSYPFVRGFIYITPSLIINGISHS